MSEPLGIAGRLTQSFITSALTPLFILAALAAGLLAVVSLPREEEPQISVPLVDIFIQSQGLAAQDGVKLVTERAPVDPKVFLKIHMHFTVSGKGIPASAIERAVAMSHDKYCSASIMLAKTAEITTSFELLEA